MEEKTMISIVTPCLNEAKYLPIFLGSLTRQTFKNFELIVVDGGSTDASRSILASYFRELNIIFVINTRRNIGFIRDFAAQYARGDIMFHTSVDTYFEPLLLERINWLFKLHPELVSLAGRTYPIGTSILAHLGYQCFDFLRWLFTVLPLTVRKYRPSGNFMVCTSKAYNDVGGYPHVRVNEDGLIGGLLDQYAAQHGKQLSFRLNLYVGHHVKKFEKIGGVRAIMFYVYALTNLFPMFKKPLQRFEDQAALVFEGKATLQEESSLRRFWNWL